MQNLSHTELTSIDTIMKVRKSIPQYQRDFVWEDSLVSSFLDNIYDEFEKGTSSYFTGSMVLYTEKNSKLRDSDAKIHEIVDGQQRITVLYTLISEILNKLKEIMPNSDFLTAQKNFYISTPTDINRAEYLFTHKRSSIRSYLESIGDGTTKKYDNTDDDVLLNPLKSCKAIVEKFIIAKNLEQKNLKRFYDYVLYQVKVTYYLAEDINEALLIYSRLNSGGKVLGHLEIIKGKLFYHANKGTSAEWEALDERWETFAQLFKTSIKIGGAGHFKSLILEETFISYYFFVKYPKLVNELLKTSDGFMSTNKISEFLLKPRLSREVFGDPIKFIEDLTKFTKNIYNLRIGNYPLNDKIANTLKDIALLSQTQTQPLMFLLSCLNSKILDERIVDRVFYLVFIFSMSVTGSGSTSAVWKNLGNAVNSNTKVKNKKDISELITKKLDDEISKFWNSHFEILFDTIRIDQSKKKVKTILAVLEMAIRRSAGIPDKIYYNYFPYTRGLDVDHLHPQSEPLQGELNEEEKGKIIQSIGNAAFLDTSDNRALQGKSFDSQKKQEALKASEMFGTKSVVCDEANGRKDDAVSMISTASEMNATEIETRKKEMLAILKDFVESKKEQKT